uniref:Chromosome 11 open reading frame 68 n=1 Tax=Sinocyclocheilus anshuiensis TaxID=1608454 RepID=A0A671PLY7_9TELE
MAEDEHLSAEDYAAEAMAADMDPWIVFDARKTPRAEFSSWLESNRPSQVSRCGAGGPVGWIAVRGPQYCEDAGDVEGLQDMSPRDPRSDSRHVICVYNQNFTEEEQVMRLDAVIHAAGVKCVLYYKPDVYSYLGIYRNNRWKICPTIYESMFDLESVPHRSHIINKVTSQELT